jgi:hypothetical protein
MVMAPVQLRQPDLTVGSTTWLNNNVERTSFNGRDGSVQPVTATSSIVAASQKPRVGRHG